VRKIVVALLVSLLASLAAIAGCSLFRTRSSDEDSIRVKNGSMHIETTDGLWTPEGNDFSNETKGKVHQNNLWVVVTYNNGDPACKAGPAHPVIIRYSDPGVQAHFNPGGNPARTKVKLTGQWTHDDHHLNYGTAGRGSIAEVQLPGSQFQCDITASKLKEILICSHSNACK
jgi:hypothetical protein